MHQTLEGFKLGANKLAREAGVTADTPEKQFRMSVLAPRMQDNEYGTTARTLIVSASPPPLFDGSEVQLWLEIPSLKLHKSTNWKVSEGAEFEEVFKFYDIFPDN